MTDEHVETIKRAEWIGHDEIGPAAIWTIRLSHGFETRVYGGPLDGAYDEYETRDEAERGHAAMAERVRQNQ